MSQALNNKRTFVGKVVSNKMEKTLTVLVEKRVKHHLYDKLVVRSKKYHVRNEGEVVGVGDVVEIKESRPFAKTVSWVLVSVISRVDVA